MCALQIAFEEYFRSLEAGIEVCLFLVGVPFDSSLPSPQAGIEICLFLVGVLFHSSLPSPQAGFEVCLFLVGVPFESSLPSPQGCEAFLSFLSPLLVCRLIASRLTQGDVLSLTEGVIQVLLFVSKEEKDRHGSRVEF